MRHLYAGFLLFVVGACATAPTTPTPDTVVISVIGTNDVHGELIPQSDRGGIVTFSGYVAALREARSEDGAVLLVDAGDMWQGTLESNLSEGAAVVQAYNELGYAAAAIGNHEFDFGPAGPKSIPTNGNDDPREVLKLRATETNFPLLAANLVDTSTNRTVEWDNVRSSILVDRAGVDIGIIGVVTEDALTTTIAANTTGVRVDPLAPAIIAEARSLRADGADLVVVVAHAGSRCTEFEDPKDLSSCDLGGEIMRVARAIPAGLVDHMIGGHQHQGIAHIVNGIAVTSSFSNTRAFSRVDFTVDRATGHVMERRIFPPQRNEARASYEGHAMVPMPAVVAIAEEARGVAAQLKAESVGVFLETPMTLRKGPEAELGNLLTDAVREMSGADIAVHNVRGGIRAELTAGELTFGSVFRMFPFDNRIAVIPLSGAELREIVAKQVHNAGRRAGFSGMRIFVECHDDRMAIRMLRPDGTVIADTDTISVVVNDFLLMGGDGVLTPAMPEQGFDIPYDTPLVRDLLVQWFRDRGGHMHADDFLNPEERRWNLPKPMPAVCVF